jgi:hypothetical protein
MTFTRVTVYVPSEALVIDGETTGRSRQLRCPGKHEVGFIAEMKSAITDVATALKTAGSWLVGRPSAFADWVDSKLTLPAPTATPANYKLMSKPAQKRHDAYCSLWAPA